MRWEVNGFQNVFNTKRSGYTFMEISVSYIEKSWCIKLVRIQTNAVYVRFNQGTIFPSGVVMDSSSSSSLSDSCDSLSLLGGFLVLSLFAGFPISVLLAWSWSIFSYVSFIFTNIACNWEVSGETGVTGCGAASLALALNKASSSAILCFMACCSAWAASNSAAWRGGYQRIYMCIFWI